MVKNKKYPSGFTLIEMLVVVLIIGILAGIALPQYQMAVTKAKVASILPIMRRWYDALQEYKLQHGSYLTEDETWPDADTLGVNWPSDWECYNDEQTECHNDYWNCFANEEMGKVYCNHDGIFVILMYPPENEWGEELIGKRTCFVEVDEGHKVCKALGGKLIAGYDDTYAF